MRGWAAGVGAWNLATDGPTAPLSDELEKDIDRLVRNGNNGYGAGFGRTQARSALASMLQRGRLDRDLIMGAVFATNRVSPRGIERLGKLIDTVR